MSPLLHFGAGDLCATGQKKTPGPRHEVSPRIATDPPHRPLSRRLAREGRCALVELVELEAPGEVLRAVAVEEVVGLLVVEDRARPGGSGRAVPDDRTAGEVLQLLDRPEPLLRV